MTGPSIEAFAADGAVASLHRLLALHPDATAESLAGVVLTAWASEDDSAMLAVARALVAETLAARQAGGAR